jgi:hypothetical protein
VPVTLEQKDALTLIQLEGAIDVGCAAELKELLIEKLKSGSAVYVALEAATVWTLPPCSCCGRQRAKRSGWVWSSGSKGRRRRQCGAHSPRLA